MNQSPSSEAHIGSSLDSFLAEESILEEVNALSVQRVLAWKRSQEMNPQDWNQTKTTEMPNKSP